jgi:uncharacterized membrane protein (DUF106 family)
MPTPPRKRPKKISSRIKEIQIELMMDAEEKNATGLNKLSSQQLQLLNAWLNMHKGKLAPGPKPNVGGSG